jgi:hypothetical protein
MTQNKSKPYSIFFMLMIVITAVIATSHPRATTLAAPSSTTLNLGGGRIKHSTPAAADLNGNGYKELVVGAVDGMLYVVAYNGATWSKVWSRQVADDLNPSLPISEQTADNIIESAVAIADIDNDGNLEIVVTTGGTPNAATPSLNRPGGIIVYERDSDWVFSVKSGWPFLMPDTMGQGAGGSDPDGVRDGIRAAPALGDIDGDGDLEIITISYDRRIRAFHHDGTVVNGWPIEREAGDIILRGGDSSPALGDIDNDGLDEIVVGTLTPPWNGDNGDGPFPSQYDSPDYSRATLWAINGDSTLVDGFPVITEMVIKSSPALGDIDGDGTLEIVVGTGNFSGYINGHQVYAWHGDGTPVSGWPKATEGNMMSSPALADLNEDGVLDVIIGCGADNDSSCKKMYAWKGDGSNLPGFPMTTSYSLANPPVVADIDNDGKLEILQTTNLANEIQVIQHNGSSSAIDTSRSAGSKIWASVLVDDLDNDGMMETVAVAGSSQAVMVIFEETGVFDFETAPWPTFQHDAARTGAVVPPKLDFPSSLTFMHQQGSGNTAVLIRAVHNDGGGEFDWTLDVSNTGGAVSPNISSGTVAVGERDTITLSVNVVPYTQYVWHNLGTVSLTGKYNGQNVNGSPMTIPVKLYVGDIYDLFLPMTIKN